MNEEKQINLPLPTGWANTQDATALNEASRERNVLLMVLREGQDVATMLSSLPG